MQCIETGSGFEQRRGTSSDGGMQTEETAAAMARAWLALPEHVKEKGWPEFVEATGRVAFFGR